MLTGKRWGQGSPFLPRLTCWKYKCLVCGWHWWASRADGQNKALAKAQGTGGSDMSTLGIKGPYLIFKLILRERKRKGGRAGGRETSICCCTYLSTHWLLLVCALNGDQPCNLGLSGWRSKQVSSPARTWPDLRLPNTPHVSHAEELKQLRPDSSCVRALTFVRCFTKLSLSLLVTL